MEAYGNEVADKLAARGVLRNALFLEFVSAIRQTDSRVKLVQTRLVVEVNLLQFQNKAARAVAKAPVRRAKFDPIDAMALLNRIGHDFSRTQVGKGRYTFKCRRCLIRGDQLFLKRLQCTPCFFSSCHAHSLPAPVPVQLACPQIDEPESFFSGDTPTLF